MPLKKITIFGGSGFLGRHLVARLARSGWTILLAERHPSRTRFLQPLGDVGQISAVAAHVQDEDRVAEVVAGADAVVNLTGILYESGRQRFDDIHHLGAGNIARAAAAAQVQRLVHVSAIGANPEALANYARSKGQGEEAVRQAFPEATILRPSIVIVAQAIQMGLESDALAGQTYELGGPKAYSFKALLELMLDQIGRRRALLPLPFAVASLQATFLELLPVPPLTRDQVRMLRSDNVVSSDAKSFADLGLEPTAIESIIPTYLNRYRPGGQFNPGT